MMSCDEIRFWLPELQRRGWGFRVLIRTLSFANECISRKASGREWIYRSEQRRWSRQIERILAGELLCINGRRGKRPPGKAVLAEHPQPLVPPIKQIYDLKAGRLRYVAREHQRILP